VSVRWKTSDTPKQLLDYGPIGRQGSGMTIKETNTGRI